ncbi:MAG: GpE family phage tail protein [Deltaproteobacteria bacterium]|nr:GpE family phage tail protein [Deltaproteobacteria bacterium]
MDAGWGQGGSGGQLFFREIPSDWRECLGTLAFIFHFQPSELWEMEAEDLLFWMERAREQIEALNP